MKWWKCFPALIMLAACGTGPEPEGRVIVPVEDIRWTRGSTPVWVTPHGGDLPDSADCESEIVFFPTGVHFSNESGAFDEVGILSCLASEAIISLDRVPVDRIERILFNKMDGEQSDKKLPDPRLFYAFKSRDSLWINQFDAVKISQIGPGGEWGVEMETDYPYSGDVSFKIEGPSSEEWTLAFRQPGWTDNRPDPEASYRWRTNRKISLELAGEYIYPEIKNGYAYLTRVWNPGDEIVITFPMAVRRLVWGNEVRKLSLEYGPVVLAGKETPEEKIPLPESGNLQQRKNDAGVDEWVWTIDGQNYLFKRVSEFSGGERAITNWITGFLK